MFVLVFAEVHPEVSALEFLKMFNSFSMSLKFDQKQELHFICLIVSCVIDLFN